MSILIAAISLGLLGSFHCIGMCGPIALALPVHQLSQTGKFMAVLFYNLGRATTYAVFGLLFGLLGQAFFLGGFQQTLSLLIGSVLLISVLVPRYFTALRFDPLMGLNVKLRRIFSDLLKQRGSWVMLLTGLLNGLLPCGLVYVALAGAMASGHYGYGTLFMFVFGLGTLPAMMSLSLFGQYIQVRFRNRIRKAVPLVVAAMAVLLILRGLNLGIPMISPHMQSSETGVKCHDAGTGAQLKGDVHCKPDGSGSDRNHQNEEASLPLQE